MVRYICFSISFSATDLSFGTFSAYLERMLLYSSYLPGYLVD